MGSDNAPQRHPLCRRRRYRSEAATITVAAATKRRWSGG